MIEESLENCIAFDDDDVETRVRILPPDQFKQTQELEAECEEFISSKYQIPFTYVILRDIFIFYLNSYERRSTTHPICRFI